MPAGIGYGPQTIQELRQFRPQQEMGYSPSAVQRALQILSTMARDPIGYTRAIGGQLPMSQAEIFPNPDPGMRRPSPMITGLGRATALGLPEALLGGQRQLGGGITGLGRSIALGVAPAGLVDGQSGITGDGGAVGLLSRLLMGR